MEKRKETWELTRDEYITANMRKPKGRSHEQAALRKHLSQWHQQVVCQATIEGKPVTAEVRKSAKLRCPHCNGITGNLPDCSVAGKGTGKSF